jgi:ERF superfamily protein
MTQFDETQQKLVIQSAIHAGVQEALKKQAPNTPDLNKAFFAAWSSLGNVEKNATNPHHKNTYANLEAVTAVVKPALVKNGLCLIQTPGEIVDRNMVLRTTLLHVESGQVWNFLMQIPLGDKATAQAYGSGNTYARRYFLMTLFFMCPVDDDGNAASAEDEPADEVEELDPTAVISAIKAFKAGKGEAKDAAVERLKKELSAQASEAGEAAVAAYTAKRKELKAG